MRSFKNGLALVSLCAAMLIGAGKNAPVWHHSHATIEDDVITTVVNALVQLESRLSLPPG